MDIKNNVVQFGKEKLIEQEPLTNTHYAEILSIIEDMLAHANAGEIIEIYVCYKKDDGMFMFNSSGCVNKYTNIGILEEWKRGLLND